MLDTLYEPTPTMPADVIQDKNLLEELDRTAARLARLGGALILAARGKPGEVIFKGGKGSRSNSSPASDVDRDVEQMLRDEIHRDFPDHAVIGEELDDAGDHACPFTWVLDPLDGTSNFLNGLPLFASSVGVLHRGRAVAGAIWCATSHEMHPGVYHAHLGSELCFDQTTIVRRAAPTWRGLASEPGRGSRLSGNWDARGIGSAATECAFAAAGILRVAWIERPRIWDVAAGDILARAAGCVVYTRINGTWMPFERFERSGTEGNSRLRNWRAPLLIGDAIDVAMIEKSASGP